MTNDRRPPVAPAIDLDLIEARADTSTIGLWFHSDRTATADSEFIARARQDVPALVAEVRRLRTVADVGGVAHDSNMDSRTLRQALADAWDEGRKALIDDIHAEISHGINERTNNPYREQASRSDG